MTLPADFKWLLGQLSGHDALPGEQCYSQVRYAMEKDLQANPDRRGPVDALGCIELNIENLI